MLCSTILRNFVSMRNLTIIIFLVSSLWGCYSGEEIVFTPDDEFIDDGLIPLTDSILSLEAYRVDGQWKFEHTNGQKCDYRLTEDAREKSADAFPGPGIDTIYTIEKIRYRMLTTDLGPKMTMRIQTHRNHNLLVNIAISDYFSNSLQIDDSVKSTFTNRSVSYHDTLFLTNHDLYDVYEISVASAATGRLKGFFYSTQRGVMGFYENRETNYWARVD
jgi:hypothetical protein